MQHVSRGHVGDPATPDRVLLAVNNMHIELVFDPNGRIGSADKAGINDVVIEGRCINHH